MTASSVYSSHRPPAFAIDLVPVNQGVPAALQFIGTAK